MKRLATIVETTPVPGKKATITEHLIVIQGEDTEYKSSEVGFRVLEIRHKLIKRDPVDPSKIINESVFFDGVRKDVKIPDKQGGNACGRTFPVWEGVKEFSAEERQKQKQIAGYYTFLFGEVTFPNKKPQLVNFRITPGQLGAWITAQKALPKNKSDWGKLLFNIEVSGEKYAQLDFALKDKNASNENDAEIREHINAFITEHNEGITNG